MIKKAIFFAIFGVVLYFIGSTVRTLGLLSHFYKHHPGPCRVLEKSGGTENFGITSGGLAFATSGLAVPNFGPLFFEFMKKNDIKGRILLYDFNNPKQGVINLKIKSNKKFNVDYLFRPHGISVLEDKVKGEHLLYVVNHPFPEPDAVEKFRFNPKTRELTHEKSITSEALLITNDIAVVNEDKFYITNYQYFQNPFLHLIEMLGNLPLGGILFYDGSSFKQVSQSLSAPNGIFLSKDNRFVYVAFPGGMEIRTFRREGNNSLSQVQQVPVYSGVDNLHLSQDGKSLYASGHPIMYKTAIHIDNPELLAPSQVLEFPLENGLLMPEESTEVFYDHGDLISASTVAANYGKSLLIGSIMDTLVVCDL